MLRNWWLPCGNVMNRAIATRFTVISTSCAGLCVRIPQSPLSTNGVSGICWQSRIEFSFEEWYSYILPIYMAPYFTRFGGKIEYRYTKSLKIKLYCKEIECICWGKALRRWRTLLAQNLLPPSNLVLSSMQNSPANWKLAGLFCGEDEIRTRGRIAPTSV